MVAQVYPRPRTRGEARRPDRRRGSASIRPVPIPDPTSTLRRVYVRPPEPEAGRRWLEYGWRAEPDPVRAAAEHEAFRAHLAAVGAEVVVGTTPAPDDPDAIYAYDPTLMSSAGPILLRPGKPGRRSEPQVAATDLAAAGVPTVAGVGYRTSVAGVEALRSLLPDVTVHAFDLPFHTGPDACTHLLSFLSILDSDLAVASLPHLPVRLVQLLRERGVEIVEVPPEELDSMGPNVLALGPRVALALAGNHETRRRLEAAGVDVRTYEGEEISRKGDGGPTCLTLPLDRG